MTKQSLKPGKIICLGEILIDLLALERETPWQKVTHWEPLTGGAPANVAFGLARMKAAVSFMGCLGSDATGVAVQAEMIAAGVDVSAVQVSDQFPTRQIYVERSLNGERHFAGFGTIEAGGFADAHLQAHLLNREQFTGAIAIVTGTLLLAFPESSKAITHALKIGHSQGLTLVVDVNRRDVFWKDPSLYLPSVMAMIGQIDILKFSVEEAIWLFNTADAETLAGKLPKASVILVTDGENGSSWIINGFSGSTKAYKVHTVDTTGAGDAFLAGFLYQYLVKTGVPYSAESAATMMDFASAMGALTTTKAGAVNSIPYETEIENFLLTEAGSHSA